MRVKHLDLENTIRRETRKKSRFKIGVIDFETDPFQYGRVPKPFAVEFHSQDETFVAWGDDCVKKLVEFLADDNRERYIIWAHNGGKFDFHFLFDYIDNPVTIINARIVSANLFHHTIRDSFAIIPVPLKAYAKESIDYGLMERHRREKHKPQILEYLHKDCVYLLDLVTAFIERFGAMLTVGSTAMKELRKLHDFERMSEETDATFRQFYFGGRVQCFQSGILSGPYIGLDVNSSYPFNMRERRHPVNSYFDLSTSLPDNFDKPYFAVIDATNRGALPMIVDGHLDFTVKRGIFHACSHELEIAFKYGLVDVHEVLQCYVSQEWITFEAFVDKFYNEKVSAKANGDRIGEMFAKFMLNSCYGKFGQNPVNFKDYLINRDFGNDEQLEAQGYAAINDELDEFEIWAKPADISDTAFYDVSIAASITSGARATLLEGIQLCDGPVYCDTDSLICRDFRGNVDAFRLGAWKQEFTADHVAIAGKKLYCAFNGSPAAKGIKKIKMASKGGSLTPDEIVTICRGNSVEKRQDAPVFSIRTDPKFLTRKFRMTVDEPNELCDSDRANET